VQPPASPASPAKSATQGLELRRLQSAETAEKAAFYAHTETHLLVQAMADAIARLEWELADGKVPRDHVLDWAYKLIPVRQPPLAIEIEAQVAA
jgi:hypothetical protein